MNIYRNFRRSVRFLNLGKLPHYSRTGQALPQRDAIYEKVLFYSPLFMVVFFLANKKGDVKIKNNQIDSQ
jgi:hypothetical protein